jgi:hypothetical protein
VGVGDGPWDMMKVILNKHKKIRIKKKQILEHIQNLIIRKLRNNQLKFYRKKSEFLKI